MTTQEHIYAIKNILNQGPASRDARISNDLIAHYLKVSRSLLLHRKLQTYRTANELNYTTICVPLEESDYHDCSCVDVSFNCKVYKSTCQLPKEITGSRISMLTVRAIDGTIIPRMTVTQNSLSDYSLANKVKKAGWLIENQNLILLNAKAPYVLAKAIWEDPDMVSDYCGCSQMDLNVPCYDSNNDEFPIDSDLVFPMYEMTMQALSRAYSFPLDMENDARTPLSQHDPKS